MVDDAVLGVTVAASFALLFTPNQLRLYFTSVTVLRSQDPPEAQPQADS